MKAARKFPLPNPPPIRWTLRQYYLREYFVLCIFSISQDNHDSPVR